MRWCTDHELSLLLDLPAGYRVERLRSADVEKMSVADEQWYPDISVGIGSVYLDPSFYRSGVALYGDDSKDFAVWVFHQGPI
jgi:hypothetical protein